MLAASLQRRGPLATWVQWSLTQQPALFDRAFQRLFARVGCALGFGHLRPCSNCHSDPGPFSLLAARGTACLLPLLTLRVTFLLNSEAACIALRKRCGKV